MTLKQDKFDAFLSHSHEDAEWVERLAMRLVDECGFRIWLDKWVLVPGESWQQAMAKGLDEALTCAVCIGAKTPKGWFRDEIERALDLQTKNSEFRVIPVLLPDASSDSVPGFLSLRTWADFRTGRDSEYAFHVLKKGILGEPIGRWPMDSDSISSDTLKSYGKKIIELREFHELGLDKQVMIEFQRKILDRWFKDEE